MRSSKGNRIGRGTGSIAIHSNDLDKELLNFKEPSIDKNKPPKIAMNLILRDSKSLRIMREAKTRFIAKSGKTGSKKSFFAGKTDTIAEMVESHEVGSRAVLNKSNKNKLHGSEIRVKSLRTQVDLDAFEGLPDDQRNHLRSVLSPERESSLEKSRSRKNNKLRSVSAIKGPTPNHYQHGPSYMTMHTPQKSILMESTRLLSGVKRRSKSPMKPKPEELSQTYGKPKKEFSEILAHLTESVAQEAVSNVMNRFAKQRKTMHISNWEKQLRDPGISTFTTDHKKTNDKSAVDGRERIKSALKSGGYKRKIGWSLAFSKLGIIKNIKEQKNEIQKFLESLGINASTEEHIWRKYYEEVREIVDKLTNYLQNLLQKFMDQSKKAFFHYIEETINYTFFQVAPMELISEFAELIVVVLFSYSELDKCIWCCSKISDMLHSSSLYEKLSDFYEYQGKSHHLKMDSKNALRCFYKMLFVSLYEGSHALEMQAYELLGQEYYIMGNVARSKFFHDKTQYGESEPRDSEMCKLFPFMRRNYTHNHKEKLNSKIRELSPDLEYYEDLPLEGSAFVFGSGDERLKPIRPQTAFNIQKKIEERKVINARKRAKLDPALGYEISSRKTLPVGEITWYNRSNSEFIERVADRIGIEEAKKAARADPMIVTHRSTNRVISCFNKHHKDIIPEGAYYFPQYQTYLTESGLLNIIKHFNRCGILIEKMCKRIEELDLMELMKK